MRRWLRALTHIKTGTIFGWRMKVNWSQDWFTVAAELSPQWGWKPRNTGLEGAAGADMSSCCPGQLLHPEKVIPNQNADIRSGNCTQQPNQQELCFLRVLVTTRLDPEGLLCLEQLRRSRCHFLGAVVPVCGSSFTPGAVLQLRSSGMQQENTSILQTAETRKEWRHQLVDTVSNRGRDPAQTLRYRYVTWTKSSLPSEHSQIRMNTRNMYTLNQKNQNRNSKNSWW